ncbi:Rz1-like lysis system protein LysC [Thalassovita sp.]|uniref:Rz1-like lysis system protein LysC n=1 Tax=Thalassovita sp. TaxID=1979401 RepID=UPI003B63F01F
MRLFPLCCALLLSGCLRAPEVVAPPPPVPADLLRPCEGYGGPVPRTEGQFSDALLAEARGRACANAKLEALKQILE